MHSLTSLQERAEVHIGDYAIPSPPTSISTCLTSNYCLTGTGQAHKCRHFALEIKMHEAKPQEQSLREQFSHLDI